MTVTDRLLKSSAKQSYDPEVDLDWDAPLVDGLWYMQPERVSLYGTALWDRLSEEQRIELSRHEVASISSVGLWFELILMQMMVRDLYAADPRTPRMHYALTEVGDECRHSLMFGKAIEKVGAPAYGPQPVIHRLGRLMKTIGVGASAYASILVAEEILDRWQRELMKDERVQPLVRMVCRIHVLEEARHMTFARDEVESMLPDLSKVALTWHQVALAQTAFMVARALVNPEVYRAVGIDPREGRRAALGNPHYQDTLAWMGERVTSYLDDLGLIPRHQRVLWKKSMLIR
ncbi:diiron oxygenase [Nocardioides sp. YIM 152315]|uniref:AurF N-oxygenase family protein n=1 Tax=Nocardioides sp. YIM 152315 TaxID=3031760 RepID=UPI0023DC8EDD|nr:diiron oxygenase [Nocardioides sp. YIM 152315]MDF1606452.1 diiron oxygenase [Nocardioides sp. YIM 152315]